jgi:hypothetical protein
MTIGWKHTRIDIMELSIINYKAYPDAMVSTANTSAPLAADGVVQTPKGFSSSITSVSLVEMEQWRAKMDTLTTVRFELTPFRTTEFISKMETCD